MEITYFEFIGSLKKYIEDKTGVKTIWRYFGYKRPSDYGYIEIEYVNSNFNELTKSKELIHEDVFLNIGIHGLNLTELSHNHKSVMDILMYANIPLYSSEYEKVGTFSIEHINGVSNIMTGTRSEDLSNTHRLYIDVSIPLAHFKRN
ncbi:hypothetical protein [Staphylococcus felis]|uniref:hypothetical protein n=1 Tax=Staphylococcus felis TaxID=46127 RepID=UPI000CD1AA6E|nr:hypothetical protein [Staphylococcus felis]AVP37421.1 hypothetical protein C7J90_10810 [Staphylococcus felis]PNZ37099.1 hypothetical protein CD143_02545 [Staphylococcus felis]QQB02631.1 hypothetical protein I6H71_07695 [Staphylococcus felis]